jgi:Cu(I)/Ag(I) efflux system membrane fusion protein
VRSLPGQVLTGRVAFIAPTVDAETRTVEVRVEMLNLDGELRPGDYASAQIRIPAADLDEIYDPALAGKFISPMHPQVIRDTPGDCPLCGMELVPTSQYGFAEAPIAAQQVTTIPRSAVLIGGDQSVVYVETEPGRFEIREVALGPVTSDRAVILRGVAPGEAVATEGNFLIDSQMQLSGNPSLLDPRKATEFAPGPLRLPNSTPRLFSGATGDRLDQTYAAYFAIQQRLSQDMAPASATVSQLITQLRALESDPQLSDQVQLRIGAARRAAPRLDGPLDEARLAFRRLSHALLRVAPLARGPQTAIDFVHYYCPMVPGGGGDWLQREGPLANPYWGAEMLRCGEAAGTLSAVGPTSNASRTE